MARHLSIQAEWRLKLLLTGVINLLFWCGYGGLGRQAFFPLRVLPVTPLDRAVPYAPEVWGWVYFSLYLATCSLPWMLARRADIFRYARGVLALMVVSFAAFFFFPTASPRPVEWGGTWPMRMIAAYDTPLNACPSLHAGWVAYMALLAWRMFGRFAPGWTAAIATLWGGAILVSTLATRQHYVVDLLAGLLVGVLADWWAWRGASAALTMPRSKECASR